MADFSHRPRLTMLKEHEHKAFLAVSEKQTMKCDWCKAWKAAKRPPHLTEGAAGGSKGA